jgi:succinyl-CoA synthetase beta subunit
MKRSFHESTPIDVPDSEHEAKDLLARWGLPVVPGGLATTAQEASELAERLGGAVAMKASVAGLTHKTEVGGVRLGVVGSDAARSAFSDLSETVLAHRPGTTVRGVRVEAMASGFEVLVGFVRDPVFGPMAMAAPGGVGAEGMNMERFVPAPLVEASAERLIGRVPGLGAALNRLGPHVSGRLVRIVARASEIFVDTDLKAMEMNPIAWSDGRWQILDVVMTSGRAEGVDHGTAR